MTSAAQTNVSVAGIKQHKIVPPKFVSSKKVGLSVLPEVEGCVDLLQVSREVEAGEPLWVTFLQLVCFVDPHFISWDGKVHFN